jgi:hypothetical protein
MHNWVVAVVMAIRNNWVVAAIMYLRNNWVVAVGLSKHADKDAHPK